MLVGTCLHACMRALPRCHLPYAGDTIHTRQDRAGYKRAGVQNRFLVVTVLARAFVSIMYPSTVC